MTGPVALARLLDDAETHGLVVNALETARSRLGSADCDSEADRRHFARVSSMHDQVVAALREPNTRVSEPGDTFDDILADRGARETLRSALLMYQHAVRQIAATTDDVALSGSCALDLLNVRWILEAIGEWRHAREGHSPGGGRASLQASRLIG